MTDVLHTKRKNVEIDVNRRGSLQRKRRHFRRIHLKLKKIVMCN